MGGFARILQIVPAIPAPGNHVPTTGVYTVTFASGVEPMELTCDSNGDGAPETVLPPTVDAHIIRFATRNAVSWYRLRTTYSLIASAA